MGIDNPEKYQYTVKNKPKTFFTTRSNKKKNRLLTGRNLQSFRQLFQTISDV